MTVPHTLARANHALTCHATLCNMLQRCARAACSVSKTFGFYFGFVFLAMGGTVVFKLQSDMEYTTSRKIMLALFACLVLVRADALAMQWAGPRARSSRMRGRCRARGCCA